MLVNLTCGRNPWKRAAVEDSTFKAFVKDRSYLQSILPVSDELNYILQRIFEIDPSRRASLDELYDLILHCPRFTQALPGSSFSSPSYSPVSSVVDLPLTPPYSPLESAANISLDPASDSLDIPPMEPLPGQQFPAISGAYCPDIQATISPLGLFTPPNSNPSSPQLSQFATNNGPYCVQSHISPVGSNTCSPQLAPQIYTAQPVESCTLPFPGQAAFFPTVQFWPRYGQFFSSLNVPRSVHWPCVPTY